MMQREFNLLGLMVKDEYGRYRPARGEEIIEAARFEMKQRFRRGTKITSPEETKAFLQLKIEDLEHEVFATLWLDLCGALRNVELGRSDRLHMRIRRRQLHISAATCRHRHESSLAVNIIFCAWTTVRNRPTPNMRPTRTSVEQDLGTSHRDHLQHRQTEESVSAKPSFLTGCANAFGSRSLLHRKCQVRPESPHALQD